VDGGVHGCRAVANMFDAIEIDPRRRRFYAERARRYTFE